MTPSATQRALGRLYDNPYLLLALASLFWSGNHIVGRAIAGHVPPFALSTLRWVIGGALLYPFARAHLAQDWPAIRRGWPILLVLGLTGGAVFSALNYVSLRLTTALNVSVFNSLAPVLIAAVAAAMFRDRLTRWQVLGIAVSFAGVVAIITRLDAQVLATLRFNEGDLLVFLNMGVFAVYSVCFRLRPPIHWLSFIVVLSVVSAAGTTPLFIWEHLSGETLQATWTTVLSVAYIALFPSVGAYVCWNRGVEMIGANRSGVFLHLVPLYSAVLAWLFLGEQLMLFHVLGFGLILLGVRLTTRKA